MFQVKVVIETNSPILKMLTQTDLDETKTEHNLKDSVRKMDYENKKSTIIIFISEKAENV